MGGQNDTRVDNKRTHKTLPLYYIISYYINSYYNTHLSCCCTTVLAPLIYFMFADNNSNSYNYTTYYSVVVYHTDTQVLKQKVALCCTKDSSTIINTGVESIILGLRCTMTRYINVQVQPIYTTYCIDNPSEMPTCDSTSTDNPRTTALTDGTNSNSTIKKEPTVSSTIDTMILLL